MTDKLRYPAIDNKLETFRARPTVTGNANIEIFFFPPGRDFEEIDYQDITDYYVKILEQMELLK